MSQTNRPLLPILLLVFIDLLGVGIIIPVLAPLFLGQASPFFAPDVPFGTRTLLLGLLLASYPLAQFFGAPILGGLSDHYGRKKLLILSLVGTVIGYSFFAFGVSNSLIYLIFLGRIIDGFTGGNISIALSSIADVSDPKEKARNFGLVGLVVGIGFIIGPFVGGKLSDSSLVSWFNYATPFWFAAALCVFNILLLLFQFKETLHTSNKAKIDPFMGFRNIKRAFEMPNLRVIFVVMFLLTFGFNFFTQFFQVFMIEKFSFTTSQIGDLFAYIGLCMALAQGFIVRPLSKRFLPEQLVPYSILGLSIALGLLLIPSSVPLLFVFLTFVPISNGITYPNVTALISNLAGKDSQGEILGINQSIQSLGMAFPPIIAGLLASIDWSLPILISSILVFFAWTVFILFFKKNAQVFHEV